MKFLVVDPNLAFGWSVRDFIETHVHEARVDLAQNAAILRLRLIQNQYDLILADIITAVDAEEIAEILQKSTTPIVMWSFVNPGGYKDFAQRLHAKVLDKPKCAVEDMEQLMELVGTANGQHEEVRDSQARS